MDSDLADRVVSVHAHTLRLPLQPGWAAAVDRCDGVRAAASPDDADVVVVDTFTAADAVPAVSGGPDRLLVVLSAPHLDSAADGPISAMAAQEADLTASAPAWVALRCAAFGQEVAWSGFHVHAGACFAAWQSDGAPWLDVADVVALLPALYRDPVRWNRAYELSGGAVVGMDDVMRMLEPRHDGPVMYMPVPEADHVVGAERAGYAHDFAVRRAAYSVWTTSPRCRSVSPTVGAALDRPPRPLGDYLLDAVDEVAASGLARLS